MAESENIPRMPSRGALNSGGERRSSPRQFLTAEWRALVMLNFAIDAAVLAPLVPEGTDLDRWNGQALVSVVGFRFLKTRVLGLPVPFHRNFEEINLRFYVRRRDAEGWRRGVVFIKEVVPRAAITAVARWVYNENYVTCPTRSVVELPSGDTATGRAEYTWTTRNGPLSIAAEVRGEPAVPAEDAEESFIAEHYWGYTRLRDGGTAEYRVDHPPWRVWSPAEGKLTGDAAAFYGPEFAEALGGEPASCFVAEGSEVAVFRGERIEEGS